MSRPNARQLKELARYVRACADLMELRDWTVQVDYAQRLQFEDDRDLLHDENEDPPLMAISESVDGRKLCVVQFGPRGLAGLPSRAARVELRDTVAHELTHAHLALVQRMLTRDTLAHWLPQPAYDVHAVHAVRAIEYAVDGLAAAIAPRLPLIRWPT